MPEPALPDVIGAYQAAHDRRDTGAALACFAGDATVIDEDTTFVGTDRIRSWLDTAASEFMYTRTLHGVDDLGGGEYLVRNHLSGNFPGGEVDLRYRFRIADGLITNLEIAP